MFVAIKIFHGIDTQPTQILAGTSGEFSAVVSFIYNEKRFRVDKRMPIGIRNTEKVSSEYRPTQALRNGKEHPNRLHACHNGLGAIFEQLGSKVWPPISFASRFLNARRKILYKETVRVNSSIGIGIFYKLYIQ